MTCSGFFHIYEINKYKNWLKIVVKAVQNDNFYVGINSATIENGIII
jgi:hypothetical protein